MNNDLVSVVIITYKRPDRLTHAISTVQKQTYKNLEILVIDGANSEENKIAVDMFAKNDKRIKYVQVEQDAVNMYSQFGMQHSRNVGCKLAKGKYIAMLDDDDTWREDKIEKQLSVFHYAFSDDVALVICYNKNIEKSGEYIEKPLLSPTYEDLLKSFNLSSTSTFLIRKDILKKVGWWNEKLYGMHEYDIGLKIAKLGYRIITVQEPLMIRYRISNQSGSYNYIKIAEVMDFWRYYGKDIIPYLGYKGFIGNVTKTLGLFFIFMTGYFLKDKTWKIIYPLKQIYEQGEIIK